MSTLSELRALNGEERLVAALEWASAVDQNGEVDVQAFKGIIQDIFADDELTSEQKVRFGEMINDLGDPRLSQPKQENYWVSLDLDGHSISVGRHLVTIAEWKAFLEEGYYNDQLWSQEGLIWRNADRPSWKKLSAAPDSQIYMFDNQPVVGVCIYEAQAYAALHQARLMSFDERIDITRGVENRPYPWGAPFGQGNANTKEEGIEKPCAVGLFARDRTPEGVTDLAGNVAEWTEDDVDGRYLIHPGAWNVDSMASWAKASHLISPAARTGYLGFRLVRDS